MRRTLGAWLCGSALGLGLCLVVSGLVLSAGMGSALLCSAGVYLVGLAVLGCIEVKNGGLR